jgi:hypothetical protein
MNQNVVINGHVFTANIDTRVKVVHTGTMTINGMTLESDEHDSPEDVIDQLKQMARRLKYMNKGASPSDEENTENLEPAPAWMARGLLAHQQLETWNKGEPLKV